MHHARFQRNTFMGNKAPVTVEDQALHVISPHDDNNRAAFGELMVAQIAPKAAWRFDYGTTPNTRLYTAATANGGTTTISQSRLLLQTSANAAGSAQLQTNRRLRYLPGLGGLVRFTAVFDAPANNNTQIVGLGDANDGFFFGYLGTAFGIVRRRAGVDSFVDRSAWNGIDVDITPQLGNVYQIRYQWLGYGYIRFYILDPDEPSRGYALVHTIHYPNTAAVTSVLNPTLPLFAQVANSGNASNIQLYTPSAMGGQEGQPEPPFNPLDVANSYNALATFADTNNNHLLTIHNKATFSGVANRVPVSVRSITLARSSAGATLTTLRLYRNATFGGALVYADIDTNNSPVEASATTTTVTGGTVERTYVLGNSTTTLQIDFEVGELMLGPNDTLTIAVQDNIASGTVVSGVVNWFEEF